MKLSINTLLLILVLFAAGITKAQEQHIQRQEYYGNTLNVGVGLGYYGYVGHSLPVLHADYEFDIARNFTLAPFIGYYSYQNYNYWGDPHYQYRDYYYRETVIPIGVKAFYYFDNLLNANSKWDFYLAGSLGFAIRSTVWETGYYGGTTVNDGSGPFYLDIHVGAEYHITKKTGLYIDLSTGVSTLGLGFHF